MNHSSSWRKEVSCTRLWAS